jgi:hypothetical protein
MKAPTLIIFVVTATPWADTINFDDVKAGTLPANWLAAQTGSGAAKWDVEMADDAPSKPNVLKQSGIATFPVCIKRDTNVENGFVAVNSSQSRERRTKRVASFGAARTKIITTLLARMPSRTT